MIKRINILIPDPPATHAAACIAQGFAELGWEVVSNYDFHSIDSRGISTPFAQTDRSFIKTNVPMTDGPVLLDIHEPNSVAKYMPQLEQIVGHRPIGVINLMDWANYTDYDERFVAFSCHTNSNAQRQGRIVPLGVGLSQDIIDLSAAQDLSSKTNSVIKNFNPTFRQSVRESLELSLIENLQKVIHVDNQHADPEKYMHKLSKASAVCAYCGEYASDYMSYEYLRDSWLRSGSPLAQQFSFKYFRGPVEITRFDSFRFYEACVFGCAPIQLDFDKYGLELPVKPVPWIHYIPIDLASVSSLPVRIAEELSKDPDFLAAIGRRAREWVLENYSPKAVASYVLKHLVV